MQVAEIYATVDRTKALQIGLACWHRTLSETVWLCDSPDTARSTSMPRRILSTSSVPEPESTNSRQECIPSAIRQGLVDGSGRDALTALRFPQLQPGVENRLNLG